MACLFLKEWCVFAQVMGANMITTLTQGHGLTPSSVKTACLNKNSYIVGIHDTTGVHYEKVTCSADLNLLTKDRVLTYLSGNYNGILNLMVEEEELCSITPTVP